MTTAKTASRKAKALRDPDAAALAAAPEKPEDLPSVEAVDWPALVQAALGPKTSIESPMPQLLLRMADTLARVADNGEHLKFFVGGTNRDQEDLTSTTHASLRRASEAISALKQRVAVLERENELLRGSPAAAPVDLATVQR